MKRRMTMMVSRTSGTSGAVGDGATIAAAFSFFALAAFATGCSARSTDGASPGGTEAVGTTSSASSISAAATKGEVEGWRKAMTKHPLPKEGCFQASHPSLEWVEVPCGVAPNHPLRPRHGGQGADVGNGNGDYTSIVSGNISWAEGSFPSMTGVTSEADTTGLANNYSLQLNSNQFSGEALCSGAAVPSNCLGWQQFVYSPGALFIQYWLLNYNNTCPSGWNAFSGDCFRNSTNSTPVPGQPITNLTSLVLTGVAGSGTDSIMFSTGTTLYAASVSSVLNLNLGWKMAEFNIFGPDDGLGAAFNSGATVVVKTLTDSVTPTQSAPTVGSWSTTGETNNLNLTGSACTFGGVTPGIQFTESNASGATAAPCPPSPSVPAAGSVAGYARSDAHSAILYRTRGSVSELSLSGSTWTLGNLTALTGAPQPESYPAAYVRNDRTNAVLYRSLNNDIQELRLDPGSSTWAVGDLSAITGAPAANGDPAAYVRSDGSSTVVYRGIDQDIHELDLPPGSSSWRIGDLSAITGAPAAVSDPMGYVRSDAVDAVVYASSDGHIHELSLIDGSASWAVADLSALTSAPAAVGMARGYVRADGHSAVVYRTSDGHIHELDLPRLTDIWHVSDLTALTGATAAASDPVPYVRSDDWSTVVYVGTDGDVHELGLGPTATAWQVGDLSAITGAPAAVNTPSGYVRADGFSTVVFQSSDAHVHELFFSGSAWSVADLTNIAGGP